MKLYATRIGIKDPDILDITVKSSSINLGSILAPTWEMVASSKLYQAQNAPLDAPVNLNDWFSGAGPLSWAEYTEQYIVLMRRHYAQSPAPFISLLKAERRVLACYCTRRNTLPPDACQ